MTDLAKTLREENLFKNFTNDKPRENVLNLQEDITWQFITVVPRHP